MSIGERITTLRKDRSISQTQLAALLDVTRQAVSKWENDLTSPDTIKLIQLADVLDTDVEYLATGNHSVLKAKPEVITITKPVEVERIVERVVEKPVTKIVEVEKEIPVYVDKPVIRKVYRKVFVRNPLEYLLLGMICLCGGIIIGLLL